MSPVKFAPTIWVVEKRDLDGYWRPIRVPAKPPFSKPEAQKCLLELRQKYKWIGSSNFPLRVVAYEQALVSWSAPHKPESY
jgi:hypothetical protein